MKKTDISKKTVIGRLATALVSLSLLIGSVFCAPVQVFGEGDVAGADEMTTPEEVGREGLAAIPAEDVPEGEYEVDVDSSSSMFRIIEATLYADDDGLRVEMVMSGKGYLYVYPGSGQQAAQAPESEYIPFVENEDGAHTFTIPVTALNEEFQLAAFSKKKEKWYDRQVLVYAPPRIENKGLEPATIEAEDGSYEIEVSLDGGSGRASVTSPAVMEVRDQKATLHLEWSSPNYDYMYVNGKKYLPVEAESGNSLFEIPVYAFDEWTDVLADTTAMSRPHEIRYRILLKTSTMEKMQEESNMSILLFAIMIIAIFSIATVAAVAVVTATIVRRRNRQKNETESEK